MEIRIFLPLTKLFSYIFISDLFEVLKFHHRIQSLQGISCYHISIWNIFFSWVFCIECETWIAWADIFSSSHSFGPLDIQIITNRNDANCSRDVLWQWITDKTLFIVKVFCFFLSLGLSSLCHFTRAAPHHAIYCIFYAKYICHYIQRFTASHCCSKVANIQFRWVRYDDDAISTITASLIRHLGKI